MIREKYLQECANSYLAKTYESLDSCDIEFINCIIDAFEAGAEWADANPKSPWISVNDDLPCNHEELMVKDEKGRWETKRVLVRIQETYISSRSPYFADCMMSKWDGEENGFLWHLCSQGYITHWMQIPKLEEE